MAGDYTVAVTKVQSATSGNAGDGNDIVVLEPGQEPPPPKYLVPKGYSDPAKSGLKATIAKGKNELKFELDSKFKP